MSNDHDLETLAFGYGSGIIMGVGLGWANHSAPSLDWVPIFVGISFMVAAIWHGRRRARKSHD